MTNTSRSEASLLAALRAPRSGDPPARDPDDFSVVLGGPLVAFALNAWKVFHVSADVVNEEFVIALSVKRLFGHLLCLALAGGLLLLLVCYAFVENFKIVAR